MKTTIPQSRPKGARYACTACGAGVMGVHEFAAHDAVCPARTTVDNQAHPPLGTTLPDPWPNMLVEVQADSADEWDRGAIRRAYRARHGTLYVHVEGLENPVQWHPDEIREVRTPDGVTVWKRPAAKVTT